MKLELKHLAPYFPYRLNMCKIDNGKYFIVDLQILNIIRDYDDWKPILRPLSDLTKEIEHNGKTFVPIEELEGYHDFSVMNFEWIGKNPLRYPYSIIQKLFEWRFDVFGLIDAGLAIDINTIK